jgi:FKBP-type peptidyl-prolyl cis-trans isomerase
MWFEGCIYVLKIFSSNPTLNPDLRSLQVTFHYVGYNESGRRIDSTYLQGTPAKIRLGNNALVPGEMRN